MFLFKKTKILDLRLKLVGGGRHQPTSTVKIRKHCVQGTTPYVFVGSMSKCTVFTSSNYFT
jgi:hypothetical protein